MYCMKCGKEIEEKQVFCDSCLEVMKQFPVKPETHIQLPTRFAPDAEKKPAPRKKALSMEEQLSRMRKAVQWLSIALAVTVIALTLSITLLADTLASQDAGSAIGQNFSTADDSGSTG